MAPTDPKQVVGSSSGGFFASIASTLSTFSTAMHKSVNGYDQLRFSSVPFFFFKKLFPLLIIFPVHSFCCLMSLSNLGCFSDLYLNSCRSLVFVQFRLSASYLMEVGYLGYVLYRFLFSVSRFYGI